MKKKLTAANVYSIPAPDKAQIDVYDSTLPGFLLRVSASGARSFAVMYRPKSGPRKGKLTRMTLGRLTKEFGLGDAREKARGIMHDVEHKGADPAHDSEAQPVMFREVAQNFIKRHVDKHGLRSKGEIERQLDRYVYPAWGDRAFTSITRRDVAALLDDIEDNSGATQADRVLATIRKICNWYQTRDDDYISPVVKGMARTKPAERKRKRVLSDDEIRAIWPHLSGTFGALVKTLLLTGQRLGKVSTMRRQDIEDNTWTIPAEPREKNNPGRLKLPAMVLDIINAQPRIVGCDYVFAGRRKGPFAGFSPLKRKLDKACPLPHWTLHDLRRTAKTLMQRGGTRPDISERVLGHVIPGVEGVYDRHEYDDEKAAALEALEATIGLILDPPDDNIVEFRA